MTRDTWFTNGLVVALVALVTMTVALPSAVAQTENFGTRVQLGSDDFVPTLTADDSGTGNDAGICRIDFGTTGTITDDAFYLDIDEDTVDTYDIRLTEFGDNGPGTLVGDSDTAEQGNSAEDCQAGSDTELYWQDVDSDGDLTDADNVFIGFDSGGDAGVDAASDSGPQEYWIRLQDSGNKEAGTLVVSGDSDLVNYGNGNSVATDFDDSGGSDGVFGFFDKDGSGAFDQGDWAYLSSSDNVDDGDTPNLYSIRLTHQSDDFSSRVQLGDDDFVPTLTADDAGGDSFSDVGICRIDFGTAGTITDDSFYLDIDGDTVDNFDIRLNPFGDNDAGTLIQDGDTAEKDNSAESCESPGDTDFRWQDVDSDGDLTEEDSLFIGFESGTGGANGAGIDAASDSGPEEYWIRLQDSQNKDAGTLVVSGDNDLVNFGAGQSIGDGDDSGTGAGEGIFGFFDKDGSGAYDGGDWAYLDVSDDVDDGDTPTLYSLRLTHDEQDFASRVLLQSSDFVPVQTEQSAQICRIDFGTADTITDDTFYLSTDGDNAVDTFDLRLTPFGDNEAGTLVGDGDTAERDSSGDACSDTTTGDAQVNWQDTDNDGDLTTADNVFVGFDGDSDDNIDAASDGSDGSSDVDGDSDEFWIRLQDSGGKSMGTLVTSGDSDLVNFGGGNVVGDLDDGGSGDGVFGFFDKDNSGAYDQDDWAYLSSTDDVDTGDIPNIYSVRLTYGGVVGTGDDTTDDDDSDDDSDIQDADGDGVADSEDNCPDTANAGQADTDGDGTGDACDDDIDGDGVANDQDNCPETANAGQADADGDGTGDACDDMTDSDGDGVADDQDNCPDTANPNQADRDRDGTGDACDDTDDRPDADGDGIVDANDDCPQESGPAANNGCPDTTDDGEDGTDGEDGNGTDGEQETPAIGAIAAVAILGGIAALVRRN